MVWTRGLREKKSIITNYCGSYYIMIKLWNIRQLFEKNTIDFYIKM